MTAPPDQLPRISVVMPVRDGERWLREAIDSVLAQTLSDFEFVVIDDGSTDATSLILDAYRAADPRIVVLRQERLGLVAALNRGLAQSRAPLVARLDADDIAQHDRLSRQFEYLRANPDVVMLGGWAATIDEDGAPSGQQVRPHPERVRETMIWGNPFIHSTVMFRTEAARMTGGYRAAFEAAEDFDLWLRLAEFGEIAILPEVLIRYRVHGGSVTQTRALRQLYSVRLAKLAASARRKGHADPAAELSAPPDWYATHPGAFERNSSCLFRLLALSDSAQADAAGLTATDIASIASQLATLSSRENKLARAAVLNLLHRRQKPPGVSRSSLISLLFRLRTARMSRLISKILYRRPIRTVQKT